MREKHELAKTGDWSYFPASYLLSIWSIIKLVKSFPIKKCLNIYWLKRIFVKTVTYKIFIRRFALLLTFFGHYFLQNKRKSRNLPLQTTKDVENYNKKFPRMGVTFSPKVEKVTMKFPTERP